MKKKFIILLCLLFIFPNVVSASCTDQEIVKMNKLASNVKFTPIFDENTEKYNLIISNLSPLLYFKDLRNGNVYYYSSSEIILYGYNPNESYRFKFYSNIPACSGSNVLSKYFTFPGYNKWYKDPICNGLEEQKFCQKWTKYNYSAEEIVKLVEDYKNSLKDNEENNKKEEQLGFYDKLFRFYLNYYYIILPLFIISLISFIIWKRKKESSLF